MSSTQIITSVQPSTYVSSVKSATSAYKQQATENVSQSVAAESTKVSISQKAQSIASTAPSEASSSGSYDFTNMTPNQMGQLTSDGEITGGYFVLTEAQFQAGLQAHLKSLTGTEMQDAMNVANNTPTNYIQLYMKGIKDSKAAGIDTTGLENVLRQMMDLQGSPVNDEQTTKNTQPSAPAQNSQASRLRMMSEMAHADPALAEQLASSFAGGIDLAYVPPPGEFIGSGPLWANGEPITEKSRATFDQEVSKVQEEKNSIYQSEKAKGTPAADIFDKLISFMDSQPKEYLQRINWQGNAG